MTEALHTTRDLAIYLVKPHLKALLTQERDAFFAASPEDQSRMLDGILPADWELNSSPETIAHALLAHYCRQAVRLVQADIEDSMFRSYRKSHQKEDPQAVMDKAKQGDHDALLTIISVFPDAEQFEPFRTLGVAARRDAGFLSRWQKLPRKATIHGNLRNKVGLIIHL